jgi:predicted transcriptional regulator of viral defense system
MKRIGIKLGRLEAQFFAYTQFKRKDLVRCGDIAPALGITLKQERELLSRLARNGWVVRIQRGLYAVPDRLPPGGKWNPGEYRALSILMDECKGLYQITGANAFNFFGFDNQMPVRMYVYNNRISGERRLGSRDYVFIKVPSSRLGGVYTFRAGDGAKAVYSSKARTLMDAVYDWSRFNGVPRGYRWIDEAVRKDPKLSKELIDVTLKYGNKGTIRRIGFILDRLGASARLLSRLTRSIKSSKSLVRLIPTRPSRGKIDKSWGIIINE